MPETRVATSHTNLDDKVFVHLSDIHFNRKSGSPYDPDADLRRELESDAVRMRQTLGKVDAVLVTGDIAYSAKKEEYDIAHDWLALLCSKIDCAPESVWITPGNHDIDRSIIENSKILRNLRQDIRTRRVDEIDSEIEQLMHDSLAKKALFDPLESYNRFAAIYGCAINSDKPLWSEDFPLDDRSLVRVVGLNSVLFSDKFDDDKGNKLVLGSYQANQPREDGVEYLSLCHHPLDWILDSDRAELGLTSRVRIQLSGHKHVYRATLVDETVRIGAGAVHPERLDSDWNPRYNVITLGVHSGDDGRKLRLRVYARIWDKTLTRFKADHAESGAEFREFLLPLSTLERPNAEGLTIASTGHEKKPILDSSPHGTDGLDVETSADAVMNRTRRLVYRFMGLPYLRRLEIAQKLDLLLDEDEGVDDGELMPRIFMRARAGDKLPDLWDAVETAHGNLKESNPFRS